MRINKAQIKRRIRNIRVRNRNEHRPINRRIPLISAHIRLDRRAIIHAVPARDVRQRAICDIELRNPDDELGRAGGGAGYVGVVGPDGPAGVFPFEVDPAARVGEWDGAVLRDGGEAGFAGGVGAGAEVVGDDCGGVGCWSGGAESDSFIEAGLGGIDAS